MRLGLSVFAACILMAPLVSGQGDSATTAGNGASLPTLVKEVKPQYSEDAKATKVEGTVLMEAVVLPDRTAGDMKVIRSLDLKFGLDGEAVKAARQWQFKPGAFTLSRK